MNWNLNQEKIKTNTENKIFVECVRHIADRREELNREKKVNYVTLKNICNLFT